MLIMDVFLVQIWVGSRYMSLLDVRTIFCLMAHVPQQLFARNMGGSCLVQLSVSAHCATPDSRASGTCTGLKAPQPPSFNST